MTPKHITAEGIRISFVCMILFFGRLSRTSYVSFPTKIQLAICFLYTYKLKFTDLLYCCILIARGI